VDNQLFAGDNLAVMRQLPPATIDLALWDPPYNTGAGNLPYLDRRRDWPGFMRPRIAAGRDVLKPGGVMAVHIDERELFRLQDILASVFGAENFLTLLTWLASKGTGGRISRTTEYILIFTKDKGALQLPHVTEPTKNAHQFRNPDNDLRGPWRGIIKAGRTREHGYAIQDYSSGQFVTPKYGWRHPPEKMIERFGQCGLVYEFRDGRLVFLFRSENNGVLPRYFFRDGELRRKEYLSERNGRRSSLHTLISGPGMRAEAGIKELPPGITFPTVKPRALAEKLISHLCPEGGLVLDAFAGSGTTGLAAANLGRRFILIEEAVPELTAERLRRAEVPFKFSL